MKEPRRAPFCWQEHRAVELIHARWAGRERATALAVYQALTYLASVRHRDGGRDGFAATRAEIADKAGSKPATVDIYARGLQQLGLLVIERRQDETGRDVASLWVLRSPTAQGLPEEAPTPREPGRPEEEHWGSPKRHATPKRNSEGSPSAPEEASPTRTRQRIGEETREQEPSPSPDHVGRARAGQGEGDQTLDDLAEDVFSILAEALTWLGANDFDRPWPRPSRATIRQALAEHRPSRALARNVALETKTAVLEQGRAPNIAGLYSRKLATATGDRLKVRTAIRQSLASAEGRAA